jgi:hypothetical protein
VSAAARSRIPKTSGFIEMMIARSAYAFWRLSPRYAFIVDEAPGWGGVLGSAMTGLVALGLALLTMIVFGGWARHFPNFRLR